MDNKKALINRVGYEPSQWISYWHLAMGKKTFAIPTEIKWLPNRGGQQQEYTLMENGFIHRWGISAYHDGGNEDTQDIAKVKTSLPDILYDTLPDHQKIKF